MSKRSRTFQPSDPKAPRPEPDGQPTSTPTTPATDAPAPTPAKATTSAPSRAEARRRGSAPKSSAPQSFFERYRILIVGGAGVVVVLLALMIFNRSATQANECVTFLTPPPAGADGSPAPAPGATPLLGFQTADLGREHAVQGASISYAYCPPASGRHYNLGGGQGPLARRFFGPGDTVIAPQWIHNLEHGNVVLLYRGEPDEATLGELRSIMDEAQVSDWSMTNCGPLNKVIALRYDDMDPSVNFAAVAWDRVLLLETFDKEKLLTFANQWQDGPQTPERVCS